ncbi:MAG: S46 family peptidase [Kofleriaceae bacterium]
MKRNAILIGLLAAACGGKSGPTEETLGTTHSTSGTGGTTTPTTQPEKADPDLAFRLAYSDPGGMWMPQQMTLPGHVETFKKMGVDIDAAVLADPLAAPLNAIVSLGGCTASFVSPDGLIVTNHHCVQGALQQNSSPEQNLVENGFLAKTRADEKSAGPSQRVWVAQAFKDVTKEMRDGLEAIKDPIKRKDESEKRHKTLIAACEKDRPEIRCDIRSYFRGGMYLQIENLEIKDVRLVYVPARSVGNYGGEIDNWAWPRHTGDFSFYRAYVGKDGKPAAFSPDNVPFKPKHFLKVSDKGLRPGDFVMVTGYPGTTNRTQTALETRHNIEWFYPYLIAYYKERYAIAESMLGAGGETAIKATVLKQGVQNGLEKYQGILDGLKKTPELLQRKEALDKQIKEWAAKPGNEAAKAAIEKYEQIEIEEQRTARADFDRGVAFGGSKLLGTALSLTRWAEERAKKDMDRKPGYQQRDLERTLAGQKAFTKAYDRALDRAAFRLSLVRALQLDEKQRPWLATLLGAKKGQKIDEAFIDKTIDAWYAAQTLEADAARLELYEKGTTAKLKASKDPFIKAALRVWPIVKAEEKKDDAIKGEMVLVAPAYVEGMKQVLGGQLAPDANGTLRITYGTVKSFKPGSKEQADWPFTTASQILAKDTGKEPFDMPKKALDAIRAKKFGPYADPALGGDLPVDFLSDLDITGGNSGSPTLNERGELVGLAFDGTTEGLASDVVFNGATTRVIHVDARYMLWNMDLLDGADHLITEMGLTPKL